MNKARGSGIGIVVAHQELSDLKTVSEEVQDQVVNNSSTKIIFRQQNPQARDYLSKMAGTFTAQKYTDQMGEDLLFGKWKTGVGSMREVQEYLLKPDAIRELPLLHAYLFAPGQLQRFQVPVLHLKSDSLTQEMKQRLNDGLFRQAGECASEDTPVVHKEELKRQSETLSFQDL